MSGAMKNGGEEGVKCPRCESPNTKFCYYNNYSLTQPRHFCKTCRRYWTKGGALRNIPIGGGCRKNKKNIIRPSSDLGPLNFMGSPAMDFQLSNYHHYSGTTNNQHGFSGPSSSSSLSCIKQDLQQQRHAEINNSSLHHQYQQPILFQYLDISRNEAAATGNSYANQSTAAGDHATKTAATWTWTDLQNYYTTALP